MRLTLAPLTNVDMGIVAAAAVAFLAYRLHLLDGSGALLAFAVGSLTFGGLGWSGAAILVAFFVPSIVLSRIGRDWKRTRLIDVAKTGARDGAQVFANGGIAAICAVLAASNGRYALAFAGAFAAAAADTWGTEIGTLGNRAPRSLLTGRTLAAGLSGGVTWVGTAAEIAGAAFVATVAAAFGLSFWIVLVAGFGGALVDSLLGASLQAQRWCAQCGRACESNPHACGATTELRRGASWIGNDAVNLAATAAGAAIAFLLAR